MPKFDIPPQLCDVVVVISFTVPNDDEPGEQETHRPGTFVYRFDVPSEQLSDLIAAISEQSAEGSLMYNRTE